MAVLSCAVSARENTRHIPCLLHLLMKHFPPGGSCRLLLPILDQPSGTRKGTICGLNRRKLSAEQKSDYLTQNQMFNALLFFSACPEQGL